MDRRSSAPSCGDLRQADETEAHHTPTQSATPRSTSPVTSPQRFWAGTTCVTLLKREGPMSPQRADAAHAARLVPPASRQRPRSSPRRRYAAITLQFSRAPALARRADCTERWPVGDGAALTPPGEVSPARVRDRADQDSPRPQRVAVRAMQWWLYHRLPGGGSHQLADRGHTSTVDPYNSLSAWPVGGGCEPSIQLAGEAWMGASGDDMRSQDGNTGMSPNWTIEGVRPCESD
jgi:hypothetical protein